MKLSEKQKDIIKRLRENENLKFTNSLEFPMGCAKALVKLKLADYNDRYDGLILTELGKTIEL